MNKTRFHSFCRYLVALSTLTVAGALPALYGQQQSGKAIGLISRVILDVGRRTATVDWVKAARGDVLDAGDMVRTGEQSIAVVKLKDNSLLRIRERSRVTLLGTSESGVFQKGARVEEGVIGFNIRKQRPGEEFRFTSPTSVASIRGTEGSFSMMDTADTFTILTGLGRIMNLISLESADVPAGFTAMSRRDGQLTVRPATEDEKESVSRALGASEKERRLKLQLKNPKGESRELIINLQDE